MSGVLVVGVYVGDIKSGILQQTDILPRAVQISAAIVGCPHVAAAEGLVRAGAGGGFGFCLRNWFTHESGARDRIIVQARDVPKLERQVDCWLAVGSEEGAVFRGVLIDAQGHMEGIFDVRHRAFELHIKSIARGLRHIEALRFRECNDGVIIRLAGSKAFSKFCHRQEVAVRGARRIRDFLHKTLQLCWMAQRQNDVEVHGLGRGELSDKRSFPVKSYFAHMTRQKGLRLCRADNIQARYHRDDGEQK